MSKHQSSMHITFSKGFCNVTWSGREAFLQSVMRRSYESHRNIHGLLKLFIIRHLTKSLYMKRNSYIESMPCRAYTGWLKRKRKKASRTKHFIGSGVFLRHWFKQHAHAHRGGKKGPLFYNTGPREESKTEMRGRRRPRGGQHEVVMRSEVVEESCEEEK